MSALVYCHMKQFEAPGWEGSAAKHGTHEIFVWSWAAVFLRNVDKCIFQMGRAHEELLVPHRDGIRETTFCVFFAFIGTVTMLWKTLWQLLPYGTGWGERQGKLRVGEWTTMSVLQQIKESSSWRMLGKFLVLSCKAPAPAGVVQVPYFTGPFWNWRSFSSSNPCSFKITTVKTLFYSSYVFLESCFRDCCK